jgi:vitamin B12 transporter
MLFSAGPRGLVGRALQTIAGVLAWAASSHEGRAELPAKPEPGAAVEVVVRDSPRHPNAGPKDHASASSVIRRERLMTPGAGAAELLRTEVGVQVTESGGLGAPATASIRGATASQLPVYLGGVRLNDDLTGVVDLGSLPLWVIERVEIYRGSAPLEADRVGMGGAIFLEPRRPGTAGSGAGVLLGSYGTRAGFVYSSSSAGPHAALLGVRLEAADNDYSFSDDRGTLFTPGDGGERTRGNADVSLVDVWALTDSRAGRARVRTLFNRVEREQGVPRLALLPSRSARARLSRNLLAVTGTAPVGQAGSGIEAQSAFVAQSSEIDDPAHELALAANQLRARAERVSQRLAGRVVLGDDLTIRPALDVSSERLLRFERRASDPGVEPALAARRRSARLASAGELHVAGPFALSALVAGECHATEPAGADGGCLGPLGRCAALLSGYGWSIYAGAGRSARMPVLGELYGMSVVVRGNPLLKAERAWTADTGLRWLPFAPSVRTFIDVALFSRWSSGLVSFVRSSEGYVKPVNLRSGRVRGLEFDGAVELVRRARARLSLSLTDPRDTSPERATKNDILPFQSRLVAVPALELELLPAPFGVLSRLTGELRYVHQSSRFADAAGLAVIPEQGSLDAELTAEAYRSRVLLRLRLANALDQRRFDVVGFPLPGRSGFGSLEVSW